MNRKELLMFLIGFLSSALIFFSLNYAGSEVPFMSGKTSLTNISPSDWITREDISVFKDLIIIKVPNASISTYAPTGSMRPLLDYTSNGIRIVPTHPEQIKAGDLVSFNKENMMIIHRIIEVGTDNQGRYYITQGDNSPINDGKIRFEDIQYVTIGILW